jgi:hypothetical protein
LEGISFTGNRAWLKQHLPQGSTHQTSGNYPETILSYLREKSSINGEMAAVLATMGLSILAMSLLNPILPL